MSTFIPLSIITGNTALTFTQLFKNIEKLLLQTVQSFTYMNWLHTEMKDTTMGNDTL